MTSRRTAVICASRSMVDSGRATSPIAPIASRSTSRSGRTGGGGGNARSTMGSLRGKRGLDAVGKQQAVDAPLQRVEGGRADVVEGQVSGVELGFHPAGMRR